MYIWIYKYMAFVMSKQIRDRLSECRSFTNPERRLKQKFAAQANANPVKLNSTLVKSKGQHLLRVIYEWLDDAHITDMHHMDLVKKCWWHLLIEANEAPITMGMRVASLEVGSSHFGFEDFISFTLLYLFFVSAKSTPVPLLTQVRGLVKFL